MKSHLRSLRMFGVMLVAVFALGAVGAATAMAAAPEFTETTFPNKFTATSATSVLKAGPNTVICGKDTAKGEVTSTDTVANVVITYTNCTGVGTGSCPAHSPKLTNSIETNTLKGDLGAVKAAEAASEVGLLLEPGTGASFVQIEGTCLSPTSTKVTGKVVGEVTPINKKQATGAVTLVASGTGNKIKEINELGKGFAKVPALEAFAAEASYEGTDNVQFAKELKVT